jgi:hypothetical protein
VYCHASDSSIVVRTYPTPARAVHPYQPQALEGKCVWTDLWSGIGSICVVDLLLKDIPMRTATRTIALVAALGVLATMAVPVLGAGADPAPATAPSAATHPAEQSDMSDAMSSMQHMKAMHEKMMAAKTPAERQALMAEHMKAMQEGMEAMQHMGGMGGAKGGMGKMMQMRMDMMTMMMQMMMDREQMGEMSSKGAAPANPGK